MKYTVCKFYVRGLSLKTIAKVDIEDLSSYPNENGQYDRGAWATELTENESSKSQVSNRKREWELQPPIVAQLQYVACDKHVINMCGAMVPHYSHKN